MTAVMLDIESDSGRRQPEQHGQEHAAPPGLGHEHQQQIRTRETTDEEPRLQYICQQSRGRRPVVRKNVSTRRRSST